MPRHEQRIGRKSPDIRDIEVAPEFAARFEADARKVRTAGGRRAGPSGADLALAALLNMLGGW